MFGVSGGMSRSCMHLFTLRTGTFEINAKSDTAVSTCVGVRDILGNVEHESPPPPPPPPPPKPLGEVQGG